MDNKPAISGILFTVASALMGKANEMPEGAEKYAVMAGAAVLYSVTFWALKAGIILGFSK